MMTMASPTATSATVMAMVKSAKTTPVRSPRKRAEGDEVDVDGVEHQLDAEQDPDGVAPGEHAEEADGEHESGQGEIGVERHRASRRRGRSRGPR